MNGLGRGNDQKNNNNIFIKETWGMILILFSFLSFICLITRGLIFGDIGLAISSFILGVFGMSGYIVVLSVLYLGIVLVTDKKLITNKKSAFLFLALFIFLVMLVHSITSNNFTLGSYGGYLKECFKAGVSLSTVTGGGLFFALIVYPLAKLISFIGCYVVFSLLIACDVFLIYVNIQDNKTRVVGGKKNANISNIDKKIVGYKKYPVENVNFENEDHNVENSKKLLCRDDEFELKSKKELRQTDKSKYEDATRSESLKILYPKGNNKSYKFYDEKNNNQEQIKNNSNTILNNKNLKVASEKDGDLKSYSENYADSLEDNISYANKPVKIVTDTTKYNSFDLSENKPISKINQKIDFDNISQDFTQSKKQDYNSIKENYLAGFSQDAKKKETEIPPKTNIPNINPDNNIKDKAVSFNYDFDNFDDENLAINCDKETFKPIFKDEKFFKEEDFDSDVNFDSKEDFKKLDLKPIKIDKDKDNIFVEKTNASTNTNANASTNTNTNINTNANFENNIESEIKPSKITKKPFATKYNAPPLDLFDDIDMKMDTSKEDITGNTQIIEKTLNDFDIPAKVVNIIHGPTVTRYDVAIPDNIQAKRVLPYADDIAMRLHSKDGVRIEIDSGQGVLAIEVPNKDKITVGLKGIIASDIFRNTKASSLIFGIGMNVTGDVIIGDIVKMTHVLIAGATGSGKSVCLNTLIVSLITKYSPEELRLILIDPKRVEFTVYNNLPHLIINEIISNSPKTIASLNWAIDEMERRYTLFNDYLVSDIDEYNDTIDKTKDRKLPKIVIIVDELADLMTSNKKEIEDRIQRLTQKSRAAGIHLVLATQRPSTDVVTGIIKANLPSRIAFMVASYIDSKIILDEVGAEKLLGYGDLLYKTGNMKMSARVQGALITKKEVKRIVNYIKENNDAYYDDEISNYINTVKPDSPDNAEISDQDTENKVDEVYIEALKTVILASQASISMIQRKYSVGYNKAGKIIDWMENMGYISAFEGSKSRQVLISMETFEEKYGKI